MKFVVDLHAFEGRSTHRAGWRSCDALHLYSGDSLSNLGRDINDPEVLRDLPQSVHENSRTGSR
jgi:hypothetical protein